MTLLSPPTSSPMRSILIGLAALLTAAGPMAAQHRVIQSPEGRGLTLVETLEGYRIEEPAGPTTAVEVSQGTTLSAFHELPGGWIAAGHRWTDAGYQLVLLRQTGGEVERLEPPAKTMEAFRMAPALLLEKGELTGLAWLEGDGGERNAVMASRWTGVSWEPVETVSPMTGEAQLALSGAVLGDGSHLLVWAAVDAGDDEVFWSRHQNGGWSSPAKLHPENTVPDIMPRVVAVPGGALVAWSQYDGKDYRLHLARFADGSWIDAGIPSEEGAIHPTLFPTARGAGFLYQTATPRSWALIEIDADGRLRRRAAMSRSPGEARPLVLSDEETSVQLRFVTEVPANEVVSDELPWRRIDWIEQP
ncbi:MAG: hypothetical protein GY769_12010 [bacterium]|nr:hypothetical protein [bacterium]